MDELHPITVADRIYESAGRAEVVQHLIAEEPIQHFAKLLRTFTREVESSDDAWRILLARLRRYLFNLRAAPVPSNDADIVPVGILHCLEDMARICGDTYPALEEHICSLLDVVTRLSEDAHNPLGEALASYIHQRQYASPVLLLKEKRHVFLTEERVRETLFMHGAGETSVKALVPRELGNAYYPQLFVIGPAYWFPPHIFQAPRSRNVHIFSFKWLNNAVPSASTFPEALSRRGRTPAIISSSGPPVIPEAPVVIDAGDIEPIQDWDNILKSGYQYSKINDSGDHEELVVARAYLLEDGYAVFLEARTDSTILTLNVKDDEHPVLDRIKIRDLVPGTFVLLRTEGSGDYIVPVADIVLGKDAARCRAMQRKWKQRLREKILEANDYTTVAIALLDLGSHRANEPNLRHWISARLIKPQDRRDFNAILTLVGLEKEADVYWDAMTRINHAHYRAGKWIRKQLLDKVKNVSTQDLERHGIMNFKLDARDAGKITAFRVYESAPETVEIPYHLLGVPFIWDE